MKSNYFLHIEGMDLAGKTTISSLYSQKSTLEWIVNNNRLLCENPIHDFINDMAKLNKFDDEIYGYLYYVSLLEELKTFKLTSNTIQDSTILLRSLNYHRNAGNIDLAYLFEKLIKRHPIPDKSIYLTADIALRKKRLARRVEYGVPSKNDLLIVNDPEKFMKMDRNLMALSQEYFNSIVLDTSNMSEDETVDEIIKICDFPEDRKILVKKV